MSPLAACGDGVLIRMAIEGRSDCFSVLMDRHLAAVKRRLRRMVPNEADVDDLVQEVLLSAWLHLATLRSEAHLRTWITRIAINQARQLYRRCQHRPAFQPLDDFGGIASLAESPQEYLLRREATDSVRGAIATLPPKYREVLALRDLTELCGKDTAERLQTTIEAVKTRVGRARALLSTRLRRSGAWGPPRPIAYGARSPHVS